jgi:hypothetical protein
MDQKIKTLVPQPQRYEPQAGAFTAPTDVLIHLVNAAPSIYPVAQRLQAVLADSGIEAEITASDSFVETPHVVLRLDADDAVYVQGYRLTITPDRVTITGADEAGLFYGVITLGQLIALYGDETGVTLPALKIMDWPDFPNRGVMLDVSRDRVPTMATLYELVDMLASWKLNQVQLYMEHTFAYRGHEVVWRDASPFTGEEMMALDAYCRDRFVELVPNQNSFGHMHRWLKHDDYRNLAECPEGCELWPGHSGEPFSLCPTDPGSIALLEDLYDQLLPHFTSDLFNVGLDETFDLGKGRSADLCEAQGTERVYLDFLLKIHDLVRARGRTMQFWGDIILHEPDLIPELPQDAVAMEWGYEATHPFAEHGKHFAEAGLRFYVCPGTSSWNTIAGRTANALGNIENAAKNGKASGAVGLLNTDWGDNGHLQPLPVSYLGYMAGAAAGWNAATAWDEVDLPAMLDLFAFQDEAGVMGKVAYDLGNVYRLVGVEPANASALFLLLLNPDRPIEGGWGTELSASGLEEALDAIAEIRIRLTRAQMARDDAALIVDEFAWAADALAWGARLGLARLEYGALETAASLPAAVREALAASMRDLLERHRALWLRRSRPGGLEDSAGRLEQVIQLLEQ